MAFGLAVLAILIPGVAAAAPARSMLRQGEPSQPARNAGELARAIAAALKTDPAWQAPIRGSVTLPETGADILRDQQLAPARQARITWRSSNPAVISDVDRKTKDGIVAKGAVTRGSEDVDVRLTAAVHVPGAAILAVPIDVTVLAKPAPPAKNEAYLFAYFPDDSADGEKIRFAISEGNNALQWKTLNDARPVLESSLGTLGLRDPFIMRSAEGDRFFLMATDLSAGRTGWSDATRKGSRYLEIWESVDLVNWGNQRHVEVNLPNAGMTWAPEAMYDASIDAYVVYWTSQLFKDDARRQPDGNGPQILMSTTRDFRTFSTPQPWFKSADLPALVRDRGMIDTTVLQEGDHFYRFTKVTEAKGCPSPDIIGQRSPSLRAAGASGAPPGLPRLRVQAYSRPTMATPVDINIISGSIIIVASGTSHLALTPLKTTSNGLASRMPACRRARDMGRCCPSLQRSAMLWSRSGAIAPTGRVSSKEGSASLIIEQASISPRTFASFVRAREYFQSFAQVQRPRDGFSVPEEGRERRTRTLFTCGGMLIGDSAGARGSHDPQPIGFNPSPTLPPALRPPRGAG